MAVHLSPKTQALINDKMATGSYPDTDAMIQQALIALDERERATHLRELLAVGAEQVARGEVVPYDDAFREEAKRIALERFARGERAGPDARP